MSELRKQLESVRGAHRAARYPGDLAAEVLSPRPSLRTFAVQGAVVAAALAAVVLLAVRLSRVPVETPTEPQVLAPADEPRALAVAFPALSVPRVPDGFALPAAPPLNFSAPGFPTVSLRIEFEADFKEPT